MKPELLTLITVKEVKLSQYQAVVVYGVVRCSESHIV
jgi:hypothetical protein